MLTHAKSAPLLTRSNARTLLLAAVTFAFFAPTSAHAEPRVSAVQHVHIKGFAFAPARIEVHVGDVVEFTNDDFAPHTATADTAKWKTGTIKNAASDRVTFATAGSFSYHCAFHPQMKATIVVLAAKK